MLRSARLRSCGDQRFSNQFGKQRVEHPAPRRRITLNDLMLHTSGLGYEFFSHDDLAFRTARGIPTLVSCTFDSVRTVLLHDPGERWTYGVNIDWLGRIVEQQRGKRLGEVMKERIFGPLPDLAAVPAAASPLGSDAEKAAWQAMDTLST